MKPRLLLIIVLLWSSFIACSDDQNDDNQNDNLELTIDYLDQSAWTGKYISKEKNGKIIAEYTIGFSFDSENSGSYTIFSNESELYNRSENIKYSVDKKRLTLTTTKSNVASALGLYWFVIEKSQNSMVLVKNLETEIYTSYLHLKRIY